MSAEHGGPSDEELPEDVINAVLAQTVNGMILLLDTIGDVFRQLFIGEDHH